MSNINHAFVGSGFSSFQTGLSLTFPLRSIEEIE